MNVPVHRFDLLAPLAARAGGMDLREALGSAWAALAANKLRAALTMLGIVIGTCAVIAMVAIGAGASEAVSSRIRGLGSNLVNVLPGSFAPGGVQLGTGNRQTLTYDDATAIVRDIPAIAVAAPIIRSQQQMVAGGLNWSTQVQGGNVDFFIAREWDVATGRLFTVEEEQSGAKVVLLGETVAQALFGETDPVGQQVRIRNTPFTVVGVLARKGPNAFGQDQDDAAFIPFWSARRSIMGASRANARAVGIILVKVHEGEDMRMAEEEMRTLLRQRHRLAANEPDDFMIRNLSEIASTLDSATRSFALLVAAIAGVSLLVGGIGIMNIMLVSVTERTKEIGLRMAVGARRRDIRNQFLIEAATLSTLGGAIGVVLGVGIALAVAHFAGWPALIEPQVVALAIGFSALVGVAFGLWPAISASRLDPIEALRHD